jgi:hypothetical protein
MNFKFEKVFFKDYDLSRFQSNVDKVFDKIKTFSITNGNIVSATINTTDTDVEHKLGREFQGWIVINKDGLGDIYQSQTVNSFKNVRIVLKSSVQVNADIYIF